MYSNWMPQNIQKRMFLYILQQLSLFSGMELPNLEEVSFNNIHLRDVSLDPEKITNIPGIKLRHGNLKHVTLKGSIKDGAQLDISGVDLVVAINIDNFRQDIMKNAQEVLAQSSADLAQTILLDSPTLSDTSSGLGSDTIGDFGTEEETDQMSNLFNSGKVGAEPSSYSSRRAYFSGGVMAKALDIALSKLSICISNVNIKIIIEPIDLLLHIEQITFSYKSGLKSLAVKGVKLSAGKPLSGMRGHTNTATPCTANETTLSDDSSYDESDVDSHDSDIYATSLTQSIILTPTEAGSIYMSATSQSFASTHGSSSAEEATVPEMMVFVDAIELSFQDLTPLSHLKVNINTINASAVPLLPATSILLNCLTKLFKLSIHQFKKRNSLRKQSPNYDQPKQQLDSSAVSSTEFLDRFHIFRLELSLTSALDDQGHFTSFADDVNILLHNFTMKLKDENLIYGGLETFEILRYFGGVMSHILKFDSGFVNQSSSDTQNLQDVEHPQLSRPSRKADLRFEISKSRNQIKPSELTLLISHSGTLTVDASSLNYLINFFQWVSTTNENLTSLMTTIKQYRELQDQRRAAFSTSNREKHTNKVILQTSSLDVVLVLSSSTSIKAFAHPLSYDGTLNHLTMNKVHVDVICSTSTSTSSKRIVSISDICVNLNPLKFDAYNHCTSKQAKKSAFKSFNTVFISNITYSSSHSDILMLLKEFKSFEVVFQNLHSINSVDSVVFNNSTSAKSSMSETKNLINSVYASPNRYKRINHTRFMFGEMQSIPCSWKFSIGSVQILLTTITNSFGGLRIQAEGLELLNSDTGIGGHIMELAIKRDHSLCEVLLERLPTSSPGSPMVQFYRKADNKLKYDVVCRDFHFNFNTAWSRLLETQIDGADSSAVVDENANVSKLSFEIRLHYHDLSIGIVPRRLRSKLVFLISSGESDLILSDRCIIKSSFRDIHTLLIDDFHASHKQKHSSPTSALSGYLGSGYVKICQLNFVHAHLKFAGSCSRVENIQPETSLVELNINVDNAVLDPCADSAHTLLQTINDLSDPVFFKDEEKFRVEVPRGFSLPPEIFENLFDRCRSDIDSELPNSNSQLSKQKDIQFVDEFYSERQRKIEELNTRLSNVVLGESQDSSGEDSSLYLLESHFSKQEQPKRSTAVPFLMKLNVNTVEMYLHDGYDWKSTRKSIKYVVHSLQEKAAKVTKDVDDMNDTNDIKNTKDMNYPNDTNKPKAYSPNKEPLSTSNLLHKSNASTDESTQTLFQSIFIELDKSPAAPNLVEIINAQVAGEKLPKRSEHEACTNIKISKGAKSLKLRRSHTHKVFVQCQNISVCIKTYAAEIESPITSLVSKPQVVSEVQIRLDTIDIEDNVQSSTWSKMLTYMNSLGEREVGTSMLELAITNARPDSRLPYSEAVIHLRVIPLRLFIDQDTLGFVTRFFSFRDSRFDLPPDEMTFVQKLTIEPLRIKFDYKPKSVNYAGIRSGISAEWVNFFILDGSDLKLTRAVVYGIHGFSKLGSALGQIYGPYIQRYQILGLLSGLTPVKSVLNVGKGVRELIKIPVQEYKRDGRLLYGLQKGSASFAKTTTNEILRLGVKLASGAQVLLENSEEYFGGEGAFARKPKRKSRKEKRPERPKHKEKPKNLLESSQILRNSVVVEPDQYLKPMSYINSAIEEDESDSEITHLQSSILGFNEISDDDDVDSEDLVSEETERYITSLYSNQPTNAKEGLKSAYKAMGKNLKSSRRKIKELRRELKTADTFQDQMLSVAKKSPVIMIRPLIGGTEALMKTLIGISNGIDSRSLQDSRDKYRIDDG